MTTLRDIALARGATLDTKEDRPPRYRAVIVEQRNSAGEDSVYVEGRVFPFYVWVRMWNSGGSVLPAFNALGIPAIDGMPVYVTRSRGSDKELEIVGIDKEILQATTLPVGFSNIGQHGWAHEMPDGAPGFDPVIVYPRAFSQLRTYSQDPLSLLVNVSPITYSYGVIRKVFSGGTVDLTAVEAGLAAGQARLVLIYLDMATNALGSTNGAIGADAGGWFLAEPATTADTILSAVVRVAESQTEIGEIEIRDRRRFLNPVPGDAGGWPYDTEVLSVDSTDPDADYSTIAAVFGETLAGNLVEISPESFTCDDETLSNDVDLAGFDKLRSILATTTQDTALTIGSDSYLRDIQVTVARNTAATIQAIKVDDDDCEMDHVVVHANNGGAGDSYGIHVDGSSNNLKLTDCRVLAEASGGNDYALYVAAGGDVQGVWGGRYDGGTADIFADGEVYLFGPELVNGTIAGAGDIYGWYYDEGGNLYVVNADIKLVDNIADAFSIVDAGGIDYLNIVTTNAQPELVGNQGGVDVDTRFEAVGRTHALFVRGIDGFVSVGRATPPSLFDVYHATDNVLITFETDKVNGTAQNRFTNDAQSWTLGINALDRFNIRDVTGAINVMLVYPGAQVSSLVITSTEVIANDGGGDVDLRWKSDNEPKLLLGDAGNDQLRLGDGDTNYFVTDNLGDTWWVGGGGLIFGSMYIPGVDIVVSIGDANPTEVENAAQDGWAAGELNLVTFPTGGTEHYLTIPKAGRYEILWNMSFHADIGGAQEVHGGVMIDGVAVRDNGEAHRSVSNANDSGDMGTPYIADLPNGTEEISLWVSNSASNDVHVEHSTVTIKLIGGT